MTIEPMAPVVDEPVHSAEVRVGMAMTPPRQNRWSIAFRSILAFPLAIVLAVLNFAAFFVAVAAWFSSLVTGRVPDSIQRFLTGWLRVSVNVDAYSSLLIARWPGIPFDASSNDQVTLEIDHADLRRSAVFFRYFLALPASVLSALLGLGLLPFQFAMWIVGIVRGRTPRVLHQATAAVIRFRIRTLAFTYLASPTQPFAGLLGDPSGASATSFPPPPTIDGGAEGGQTPPAPEDVNVDLPAAVNLPPSWSAPTSELPTETAERSTRWVLTQGAKAVVISSIGIGVLFLIAYVVFIVVVFNTALANISDRDSVTTSYHQTNQVIVTFGTAVSKCTAIECVSSAAQTALNQENTIVQDFRGSYTPVASASAQYDAYLSTLNSLTSELQAVATSTSGSDVQNILVHQVVPTEQQLQTDADALLVALGG